MYKQKPESHDTFYVTLLYDKVVRRLVRHLLTTIFGLLILGFLINLVPSMAENVIHNKTYDMGFAKNNTMRDLKNPALTIEKNPLANLSNPLTNLTNPLQNLTK